MEKIAIIGGLGTLAGADLFLKLLKTPEVLKNQLKYHFIFEQQPYSQINLPLHTEEDIKSRKYYTYNVCRSFEERGITKILLPCFASHSFLEELQKEIAIPIVNIFKASLEFMSSTYPAGTKIGVLTSDYVKGRMQVNNPLPNYHLVFPDTQNTVMDAIYGEYGLKNGFVDGLALEHVHDACVQLMKQGCVAIFPAVTEVSLITGELRRRGIPVVDVNEVYATFALQESEKYERPFKLGIMGGVGPAATVDFMNKVIDNTPAEKDQDHIKMVVEQNPQIPDRTANLVDGGVDPTIAMFATCKRLEAEGADAIAVPCNTAHAFVDSIQQFINIPIINMLTSTAQFISKHYGPNGNVGLLATTGTLQSEVYHKALAAHDLHVICPDPSNQEKVMAAIYGEFGVKAGYTDGECKDLIQDALDHLIENGSEIVILGCTELPLLFPHQDSVQRKNKTIPLIDPTLVLAKRVVNLSQKAR